MAIWQINPSPQQSTGIPPAFVQRSRDLIGAKPLMQWLVVGIVGVVLGICVVIFPTLPWRFVPLLVLAVLFPFIAMIIGSVRRLLLGLILLDIPFPLDLHLNYRADVAELNAIGGVSISVTTIALVILYALWLIESL